MYRFHCKLRFIAGMQTNIDVRGFYSTINEPLMLQVYK